MNKCVISGALDKEINGLRVFFNIIEENVERSCADCAEQGEGVHRQIVVAGVKKGCVVLTQDVALLRKVESYIKKTFRHGEVLCFNCFEAYVDEQTPGIDPA